MVKGKQGYTMKKNMNHIIICGSPTLMQIKDFIIEMFHEDHMSFSNTVGAERELKNKIVTGANTEIIFLLDSQSICDQLTSWLNRRTNMHYQTRCHIFCGTVYEDLL